MTCHRRAVILPTILFILLLLGVFVATFAFRVNADLASTQAVAMRIQTRLAAEAGIEIVKLLLAQDRLDVDRWYNNPDELHRIIFWANDVDPTSWGTNEEFNDPGIVYRYSIVADDPSDDEDFIRFGVTDESAKLHLNEASEEQLLILVTAATATDSEIVPEEIVHAILDWRDPDSESRGENGDTEGAYYLDLDKPYAVKNGPFETVEELLLVKGVTGQILYGEDFDRNGLLSPNEDDGELTFPPDDEDGVLNRGLYPYLTVLSMDRGVSNDNRQRINLLGETEAVREQLDVEFPDEPLVIDFIMGATRRQTPTGGDNADGNDSESNTEGNNTGDTGETGNNDPSEGEENEDANAETVDPSDEDKDNTRRQRRPRDDTNQPEDVEDDSQPNGGESGINQGGSESNGARNASTPIQSPAALLNDVTVDGEFVRSPIQEEHLVVLMDRTTVSPPDKQDVAGLININTAPGPVLRCLTELTDEQVGAILETRLTLSSEQKETIAWLYSEDVLDVDTFVLVAPKITARGQQFMIESLGYADHVGMITRLQVIIDLAGPIAQTVYYRDLTKLGAQYPIREEDLDNVRVQ